jgi:hypothetical protein
MQTLMQDGKYQVMELLSKRDGFEACLCIDIETSNHYRPVIVSRYRAAESIKGCLPAFYGMLGGPCSDFIDVKTETHGICTIFQYHEGTDIRTFFDGIEKDDFALRVTYADNLFKAALELDTLADFIANNALLPAHVIIEKYNGQLGFNHIIPPDFFVPKQYKAERMALLLRIIFVQNRYTPEDVFTYIEQLGAEPMASENIVAFYAAWKRIEPALLEKFAQYKNESLTGYLKRRIKNGFKKWLKGKTKGDRGSIIV